ncbi:hypothetical protein ACP3TD_17840 [Pseudarthrobacter sp. 1G09]|uniref:hypothetical protein n=1 Tax=Pseudarthrobacter sp. 1G09 TaxID=3416178 RepID=UPI003CF23446
MTQFVLFLENPEKPRRCRSFSVIRRLQKKTWKTLLGGRKSAGLTALVTPACPVSQGCPSTAGASRQDWHKNKKWVWYRLTQAQKGVIPMSGKSSKGGAAKKAGKSILEKRADKKARHENSELNFAKPRKNQR